MVFTNVGVLYILFTTWYHGVSVKEIKDERGRVMRCSVAEGQLTWVSFIYAQKGAAHTAINHVVPRRVGQRDQG